MKIISGSSNKNFAQKIQKELNINLVPINLKRFSDGEIFVEIKESLRGEEVFIIQSTSSPANENLMELFIMIDALKRASVSSITAVIPYFGYSRQDRKTQAGVSITAKLIADLLEKSGINRLLTIDLHAGQIQGFFNLPVDNLYASPIFIEHIRDNNKLENSIIVAPDVGSANRLKSIADPLNLKLAIVNKYREKANESKCLHLIGDVKGKDCIILDDIIDTAGTLCHASNFLMEHGAKSINAYATHGVLSGKALENIKKSSLKKVYITDTIDVSDKIAKNDKIEVLSVAPLFSRAIHNIGKCRSLSYLFK